MTTVDRLKHSPTDPRLAPRVLAGSFPTPRSYTLPTGGQLSAGPHKRVWKWCFQKCIWRCYRDRNVPKRARLDSSAEPQWFGTSPGPMLDRPRGDAAGEVFPSSVQLAHKASVPISFGQCTRFRETITNDISWPAAMHLSTQRMPDLRGQVWITKRGVVVICCTRDARTGNLCAPMLFLHFSECGLTPH